MADGSPFSAILFLLHMLLFIVSTVASPTIAFGQLIFLAKNIHQFPTSIYNLFNV
jgi:hypothetical protein